MQTGKEFSGQASDQYNTSTQYHNYNSSYNAAYSKTCMVATTLTIFL